MTSPKRKLRFRPNIQNWKLPFAALIFTFVGYISTNYRHPPPFSSNIDETHHHPTTDRFLSIHHEQISKQWAEVAARKGKATNIFLHIHKAAGTTMCTFAKTVFNTTTKYNCNIGTPEEQEVFISLPVKEQKGLVRGTGLEFFAIEYYGTPAEFQWFDIHTEPQFVYTTCLRHPVTRMISQYKYMSKIGALPPQVTLHDYLLRIKHQTRVPHVDHADNLMVRQLSGPTNVYSIPPGGITLKHLNTALENLKMRFSVVLIMEDMEYTSQLLETVLGWKNVADLVGTKRNRGDGTDYWGEVDSQSWDLLMELNSWDLALYDEAKKLFGDKGLS